MGRGMNAEVLMGVPGKSRGHCINVVAAGERWAWRGNR